MALSLAILAVKIVLDKIANFAVDEVFKLYGVSDEVERIRMELALIHASLDSAGFEPNNESQNPVVKAWLIELKQIADNIDKVIETFKSEIPKGKIMGILKKPVKLNNISTDIENTTKLLDALYQRGTQLGIIKQAIGNQDSAGQPSVQMITQIFNQVNVNSLYECGAEVGTTASATTTENPAPLTPTSPKKSSDVDNPEVFIGHQSVMSNIIDQLLDQNISRRTVLSIVGIGGLGKTTLAQKIYNNSDLKGRFQCTAWQSISQKFTHDNVLREILYSINPQMKEKEPPLDDKNLILKEVRSYLGDKRYLIILDDVWSTDLWDGLKKALPDISNGSRVIITTRFRNVARKADHYTKPCKLDFLTDDESVALLFKTTFDSDTNPENKYVHFRDIARKLIKKCGGLPLAVVVVGGILSEEEVTLAAWNSVYRTMNWHEEEVDKKCMNILAMSYEVLPKDYLKQCFRYFACFPEDHSISVKQMTRLWVIEELIPKDDGAGSLEDRAEKCLRELVKRCLVEVTKKSINGHVKYCRMHDLLRDLAVQKAKELNFVTVFSKDRGGGNQQLAPYRVALHNGARVDFGTHSINTRSLFCFGQNTINYQQFGQLKVLLFERVDLNQIDMSTQIWLEGLVHLRYLGFRYCTKVQKNILFSGLKSLETLDCKGTRIGVDSSLWKIPTLRHVITGWGSVVQCPLNWNDLKNLERLDGVRLNNIPTLECDLNLNTLKIEMFVALTSYGTLDWYLGTDTVENEWQYIRALLSRIEHLVSLKISSGARDLPFLDVGTSGLSCHETIQSLYLRGIWWVRDTPVLMSVEMFPKYLTKLKLEQCQFKKDPMPILKSLQSLQILHLIENSYLGAMTCSTRGFVRLQELRLEKFMVLTDWVIEEGALPVLRQLEINDCKQLDVLPELQNVPSLQELIVTDASPELHERLNTEDQHKIEHIASSRITMRTTPASNSSDGERHQWREQILRTTSVARESSSSDSSSDSDSDSDRRMWQEQLLRTTTVARESNSSDSDRRVWQERLLRTTPVPIERTSRHLQPPAVAFSPHAIQISRRVTPAATFNRQPPSSRLASAGYHSPPSARSGGHLPGRLRQRASNTSRGDSREGERQPRTTPATSPHAIRVYRRETPAATFNRQPRTTPATRARETPAATFNRQPRTTPATSPHAIRVYRRVTPAATFNRQPPPSHLLTAGYGGDQHHSSPSARSVGQSLRRSPCQRERASNSRQGETREGERPPLATPVAPARSRCSERHPTPPSLRFMAQPQVRIRGQPSGRSRATLVGSFGRQSPAASRPAHRLHNPQP